MKSPRKGFTPPDFSGQSKILFVSEGNPAAVLLNNLSGKRTSKPMEFAQAEAALAWCRAHGTMMVYLPPDPAKN